MFARLEALEVFPILNSGKNLFGELDILVVQDLTS
jgi:hypothetical protein